MTPKELMAAFPSVKEAVAYCELTEVPEMFRSENKSFAELVEILEDVIDETLADEKPFFPVEMLKKIREQFRREEFRVYLAGRMGCVWEYNPSVHANPSRNFSNTLFSTNTSDRDWSLSKVTVVS